ncbi:beta-propeller domain-containing protein [candidate division KSB1 bacterium]|nr:beta-propeller domain-containing protein [candidate division KSB1 bacterium]
MKKIMAVLVTVFSLYLITYAATPYPFRHVPGPDVKNAGSYPSLLGITADTDMPYQTASDSNADLEKILDIGGQTRSVVIKNTFAYAGEGRRLVILDISTPSQPQFVSGIELGESLITDLAVDGHLVYAGSEFSGTFIVDVSTPQTPVIAGHLPAAEDVSVHDIIIMGHYAYIAEGDKGLTIFDIQDPANPQNIFHGYFNAVQIQAGGGFCYYIDGINLTVMDISNPAVIQFVTEYPFISSNTQMIYLQDSRLFIMDNDYLRIMDVSKPDSMSEIGSIQITGGYPYDIKVVGDTAYVADYYHIDIIDIGDPGNPQFLGRQSVPGLPVRIDVTGDYAYLACTNANVKVIDCSNAAAPQEVSSWLGPVPTANTIAINENRAFVTTAESGLSIFDITDPSGPALLGKYAAVKNWYNAVGLLNNIAVIGDVDTLHVVDITDPANVSPVTDFTVVSGMVNDILIREPYVYLASGAKGFDVLDMTDPADPQEIGNVDTPGDALHMAVTGNYTYLADGSAGVRVIDINTPANPVEIAALASLPNAYDITVSGDFAYVARRGSQFINIVDISTPANPVKIDSFFTQIVDPLSLCIHNNTLFLAGVRGIQGFDIINPVHPVESVNFQRVSSWVWDMTADDKFLYAANAGMGLEVFKIPSEPQFTGLLVTNTGDTGDGSLRDAINQANNNAGPDTIRFRIPESDPNYDPSTGVWTITPATQLPAISDNTLLIEGFSQADYTQTDNNPDGPEIEINGSLLESGATCFTVTSTDCEISGLAIGFFPYAAIMGYQCEGLKISGCYLGVNAEGSGAAPNQYGVFLLRKSNNAFIGPTESQPVANIISGNNETGIFISDSSRYNTINGNIIGLNKGADQKIGNYYAGIAIQDQSDGNNMLGNRICGNRTGIVISGSSECEMIGNKIGSNDQLDLDLGNDEYGINIMSNSIKNLVSENKIAYNGKSGVLINGLTSKYNKITRNSITKNADLGIKLVNNSNGSIAPPVLATKTAIEIGGTTVPGAVVELFCDENNQGQIFMDETVADENGYFIIPTPNNPPLSSYSATATDTSGNTSEFSGTLPTAIDRNKTAELPAEYTLMQNFPNPFNPVTKIRYSLPEAASVTLTVYDILGKQVTVIVDGVRQQAGWYSYEFDAGSFASGLYLYKLETPETTLVRKMLYVK